MADKSKKDIPDRVSEWTKKLPFIDMTTPRDGHVSQYKDKANALLERMLGDKEKPVKGGAKQANRTDAYKRKEMEYSEKMYEESKRPKMDYKRAGQEAREGGMSFMGGGMVNATVRPMGMMGGGNVGYTHGGKVDGCSSIQVSGRKSGKTY